MKVMVNKKTLTKKLFFAAQTAQEQLSKLTPTQRSEVEKAWDVEHAYYSSALEGSRLDRKEFEKLAKDVK